MSAVRHRRVRRRQDLGVPDIAPGRARLHAVPAIARRDARIERGLMRLAVIRQRYTPFGGAERFLDNALRALVEHGVHVTLYTRGWSGVGDDRIQRHTVDPFYIGSLWRDASFACAVCRALEGDS